MFCNKGRAEGRQWLLLIPLDLLSVSDGIEHINLNFFDLGLEYQIRIQELGVFGGLNGHLVLEVGGSSV